MPFSIFLGFTKPFESKGKTDDSCSGEKGKEIGRLIKRKKDLGEGTENGKAGEKEAL